MTRSAKILTAITIFASVSSAFAAKPTSIKYVEDIVTTNDEIYSHYIAKCSNGKEMDLSAWDNRKSWCVGKGSKDNCNKKQIKTAKKVCKNA